MSMVPVYLDYNATAPLRPEARRAALAALDLGGNPSSVHRAGRCARAMAEDAREQVAALVAARPRQIVFTSGGTEANHLALRGLAAAQGCRTVLVSSVEHDSLLAGARGCGAAVDVFPVNADGVLDLAALEARLARSEGPILVSVMLANNETGVIQPVAEAAALARRFGAVVHCDAAQGAGRMPVSLGVLGVDALSLSAHKIGGPAGAGALVLGDGVTPAPILTGGGQESGFRAGTENVAGIAGFGAAADAAREGLAAGEPERLGALRDRLEDGIQAVAPEALIVGERASRVPNTSCIALPGRSAELQVIALDLAGVAVSAGAACSSGKVRRSHVLNAMGHGDEVAGCAIRVSLGWGSEGGDVDRFLEAWSAMRSRVPVQAMRSRAPSHAAA